MQVYKILYKKHFIIAIAIIAFVVILGLYLNNSNNNIYRATLKQNNMKILKPTIIIDPGHGGVDGGAVGVNGVVEKDLNLDISLTVRDMLKVCGYNIVMTREDDRSIHDSSAKSIRNQKKSDLHNRFDIIAANPGAITISIHQNTYTQSQYNGAQIFYSKNNPESKDLADTLQKKFKDILQPNNERVSQVAGKNLFLLWNSKNPTILIECGFLSNPDEAQKLNTKEYRNKVAYTITCGILNYIDESLGN
jgi:N-acetylmuramoyl-L-alanine amidase